MKKKSARNAFAGAGRIVHYIQWQYPQHAAHLVIHSLRQMLAPGCLPLFTSDGLNLYFYTLTAHFGQWLQVRRRGRNEQKTASGTEADLWSGEKKLIFGASRSASRT